MTLQFEWELPPTASDPGLQATLLSEAKKEVALRLFADGRVSSGFAASLLGMSRLDFIDLLRDRRIPLFAYGEGELDAELALVRQHWGDATGRE